MNKDKILEVLNKYAAKNMIEVKPECCTNNKEYPLFLIAQELSELDDWVRVEDRLPKESGIYLVSDYSGVVHSYYDGERGKFYGTYNPYCRTWRDLVITSNWQPLPNLPKDIDNKKD